MKIDRLDQKEILRYLGYKNQELTPQIQNIIDRCEAEALKIIEPKYVFGRFKISHTSSGIQVEDSDLILKGKDIASHLKGCKEIVLLGVTAGVTLDRWIRRWMISEPEAGLVLDSCGIQAVEQIADQIESEIEKQILSEGFHLTWRFSPGYGDLPLDTQRALVHILDLPRKIGVSLTESCLMVPSKSVTAILGIYDPKDILEDQSERESLKIERKKNQCDFCNNKDRCLFRKRGTQC